MEKTIYAVMCETRQRGSEEPWNNAYLVYCTDTEEEAKEDCEDFNKEEEIRNNFLQNHYYYTKEKLYTKI